MGKMLVSGLVAAAGTYFLYGAEKAKSNRKKVKSWMLKAKGEVLEQLEKMDIIDEKKYQAAVDKVAAKYRMLKNIDRKEVEETVADMKRHWKNMTKAPAKRTGVKRTKAKKSV